MLMLTALVDGNGGGEEVVEQPELAQQNGANEEFVAEEVAPATETIAAEEAVTPSEVAETEGE